MGLGPDTSRAEFILRNFHTSEQWYWTRNSFSSMNPTVPSQRISREADISIKRNILHRYLILQPSLSNEKHRNHAARFKPKELARCTMLFYLQTGNNYSKFSLSRHIHQTILCVCRLDTLLRKCYTAQPQLLNCEVLCRNSETLSKDCMLFCFVFLLETEGEGKQWQY